MIVFILKLYFFSINFFNGKLGFKDFVFFVFLFYGLVLLMFYVVFILEFGDYKMCFWFIEDEVSVIKEVIFYSFKNIRM